MQACPAGVHMRYLTVGLLFAVAVFLRRCQDSSWLIVGVVGRQAICSPLADRSQDAAPALDAEAASGAWHCERRARLSANGKRGVTASCGRKRKPKGCQARDSGCVVTGIWPVWLEQAEKLAFAQVSKWKSCRPARKQASWLSLDHCEDLVATAVGPGPNL